MHMLIDTLGTLVKITMKNKRYIIILLNDKSTRGSESFDIIYETRAYYYVKNSINFPIRFSQKNPK